MARSVNQVFLIGRLTKDIDMRSTTSGKSVASFTLAVDKQSGEGANFFDVTAWDKLAELASKYIQKGSKIHLQGTLDQQSWEQDGQKRSKVVVIARDITFLDSKNNSSTQSSDTVLEDIDDKPIDLSEIPF